MVPAAAIPAQSVAYVPENAIIPTVSVFISAFPIVKTRGISRLFHENMKVSMVTVAVTGPVIGSMTAKNAFRNDAPSITAASYRDLGVWSKKLLYRSMEVTCQREDDSEPRAHQAECSADLRNGNDCRAIRDEECREQNQQI